MTLRVTQAAPGIHQLSNVYTNWYLLEQGGRLTLLDAGLPSDWGSFCSTLSRLGHAPGDIDAVLITHHHPDHAGNAERLRTGGARVLSHPADAPYLRGEKHLSNRGIVRYLWRPWYAAYMARYFARGITRTRAVAQLDELADGEMLDVPGMPRVVHAPGPYGGQLRALPRGELDPIQRGRTGDARHRPRATRAGRSAGRLRATHRGRRPRPRVTRRASGHERRNRPTRPRRALAARNQERSEHRARARLTKTSSLRSGGGYPRGLAQIVGDVSDLGL